MPLYEIVLLMTVHTGGSHIDGGRCESDRALSPPGNEVAGGMSEPPVPQSPGRKINVAAVSYPTHEKGEEHTLIGTPADKAGRGKDTPRKSSFSVEGINPPKALK